MSARTKIKRISIVTTDTASDFSRVTADDQMPHLCDVSITSKRRGDG